MQIGTVVRIDPKGPTHLYKTYAVKRLTRRAKCAEVGCTAFLEGWTLHVESLSDAELHRAVKSGRKYTVMSISETETHMVFEAGQPCLETRTHRVVVEGNEQWLRGRGDFRSFDPRKAYRHTSPDSWVDDFASHQDANYAFRIGRGQG